jgi:predicted AAA+ superfamily ATPase
MAKKRWYEILENFFMVFRIAPWTRKISRAITKEKKLYLFNYAGIDSPAAKFENNDNQRRLLAVIAAVAEFLHG